MLKNNYLTKNLDSFLELSVEMKRSYNQFMSELIHSSFLIAFDEITCPVILSINNKDYALIFTSLEEFKKTFPFKEDSFLDCEFASLKDLLDCFNLEGYILNVSTQNFYITKKFLNGLDNIPSNLVSFSEEYSAEELKCLKDSINNEILEEFIKDSRGYLELFDIISSSPLFALVVSDKDMGILESDGMIRTYGIDDGYDYYTHNQYVSVFTSKNRLKEIPTSKFKYLSLVDFASLAHVAINQEYEGIIINPGEESYIVPVDILLKNWGMISQTCGDKRLVSAKHNLFLIED